MSDSTLSWLGSTVTWREKPYLYLEGSAEGSNETIATLTDEVFEDYYVDDWRNFWVDSDGNFNSTGPTVEEFYQLHSAEQLAYVEYLTDLENGGDGVDKDGADDEQGTSDDEEVLGNPEQVTIGEDGEDQVHAILNADKDDFYVIDYLEKSDFSKMPVEDQEYIAGTDTWLNTTSVALGMVPTAGDSDTEDYSYWVGYVEALCDDLIETAEGYEDSSAYTYYDGSDTFNADPFITQFELIRTMASGQAILDLDEIESQLSDIEERMENALAFFDVYNPGVEGDGDIDDWFTDDLSIKSEYYQTAVDNSGEEYPGYYYGPIYIDSSEHDDASEYLLSLVEALEVDEIYNVGDNNYYGVISLDDNATINDGYEALIEYEETIASLKQQIYSVASTYDNSYDAPTLIAVCQGYRTQIWEALAGITTVMIEQMNQFLEDIAVFQDLLNEHLELYDDEDDDEDFSILNLNAQDGYGDLTEDEVKAIAMFTEGLATQPHPLETIWGLSRPTLEMLSVEIFDTDDYIGVYNNSGTEYEIWVEIPSIPHEIEWAESEKTTWDTRATRISEYVTIVSQDSEILQNDLSELITEKNRYYEHALEMYTAVQTHIGKTSFFSGG